MRRIPTIGLVVALGILVGSCRLLGGGTVQEPGLDGTWRLASGSLDGAFIALVAGGEPTLTLSGTDAGGVAGCNHYGGTFSIDGDRMTVSALSMTEMACDEDRMAEEAAYSAALARVESFTLADDRLALLGSGVELRFVRVPATPDADLVGTAWLLQSILSGDAASSVLGEPARLSFDADGGLSGSTGCRTFSGSFTRAGNEITVSSLVTDDRACADDLARQDALVLGALEGPFSVAIEGGQLTLASGDGSGLAYQAELPD